MNTLPLAQPVRILIMEDDARQARLTRRTLAWTGYAVDVAGAGDGPWGCGAV